MSEATYERSYAVSGMSCARCATAIERAVRALPGVEEANVEPATRTLVVRRTGPDEVADAAAAAVRSLGFGVVSLSDRRGTEAQEQRVLGLRLAVTGFFAMNAMLPGLVRSLEGAADSVTYQWLGIASGVLAAPAIVVGGWPFFARAVRSLRSGSPGMDLLVSLGVAMTVVYSIAALLVGSGEVYFDAAAMILAFLLLGRLLEAGARRRSTDAVEALRALTPAQVQLLDAAGHPRTVAVEEVTVGAQILVAAGERVPLDGEVTVGDSEVEQAWLTGEWRPRPVRVGARVDAGSLNLAGSLVLRVVRAAGERQIDRIAGDVRALLARRAPVQSIADAMARWLVAVVLTVAAVVVVVGFAADWGATTWLRATSVVVIACPCALSLATPLALVAAAGRAAQQGILFRDGEALAAAAAVRRVYFDKTGTLTEGRPSVLAVHAAAGLDPATVLRHAAAAERGQPHPIARALVAADPEAPEPGAARTTVGAGVSADVEGRRVLVGRPDWLVAQGVVAPEPIEIEAAHMRVDVAIDGRWAGAIEVTDAPRPCAADVVQALRHRGIEVAMLTGDAAGPAKALARRLGIDTVHADQSPAAKADRVTAARRDGASVMLVGDGINDSPALAVADVGVSIADATQVAVCTAGVVLFRDGIAELPAAIDLARRTARVMRQNVAWAVGYNLVAVPAAALGLVSPILAAALMAASSVSVALNSLRLARAPRALREPSGRPLASASSTSQRTV